jgi:putative ABC transport system substrate-binding protein
MKRREFITLLGGAAAAWPLAAHAQQPAMPVIGVLSGAGLPFINPDVFRQGLSEHGFAEGRNVTFEFRSAMGQLARLPDMAADLVRRRVSVIVSGGPSATQAAKTATIVFGMGEDPVREGFVDSLARPSGNLTGYTDFTNQLVAKRLEVLREVVPGVRDIGFVVNQTNPNADPDTKDVQAAADALGLRLHVLAV